MTLFTQQWVSLSLSVSVYSRRAGCPQGRDIHLGLLLTSALSLCVSLCHCKTPFPHICILHTLNLQSCLVKYFVSTLWACVKLIQMVSLLCLDYDNSVTAWPILYLLGSFYPLLITWTKSCTKSPVGSVNNGYFTITLIIPFAWNTNIIGCLSGNWCVLKCMCKCHEYQTMPLLSQQ